MSAPVLISVVDAMAKELAKDLGREITPDEIAFLREIKAAQNRKDIMWLADHQARRSSSDE